MTTVQQQPNRPPSQQRKSASRLRRAAKPAGVATAVAAGASVVIAVTGIVGGADAPTAKGGSGIVDAANSVSGSGNVAGNGRVEVNGNVCTGQGACAPLPTVGPDGNDEAVAQDLPRQVPPTGPGPWPFVVLFDDGEGLKIRDSPERTGHQVGLAINRSTVWVDCIATSAFNPEPGGATGPRWYKVHWPNSTPSEQIRSSGPADPAAAWAFAAYLVPQGTNGNVPAC